MRDLSPLLYQPLDLQSLDSSFEGLLPYRVYQRLKSSNSIFGFGAFERGKPIGCILVETFEEIPPTAQILAWTVLENYRNKGIGSKLFEQIHTYLIEKKRYLFLELFYTPSPAMQHLLKKYGWSNSILKLKNYYFTPKQFDAPWFVNDVAKLPAGYQILPWNKIPPHLIAPIKRQEEQYTFHISVSPFNDPQIFEPQNSLGLLADHPLRIVGWMMCQRFDRETINYAALYIEKGFRHKGAAIALLSQAIKLQQQSSIPRAVFELRFDMVDKQWLNFVKKRLEPYAENIEEVHAAILTLK